MAETDSSWHEKIHSGGGIVKVFLLAGKNRYKGAARKNLDRLLNLPVDVRPVESVDDVRAISCKAMLSSMPYSERGSTGTWKASTGK